MFVQNSTDQLNHFGNSVPSVQCEPRSTPSDKTRRIERGLWIIRFFLHPFVATPILGLVVVFWTRVTRLRYSCGNMRDTRYRVLRIR